MYIKSHDKSILLNADQVLAFATLKNDKATKWGIIAYMPNLKLILGEYKCREQADIVLKRLSLAVTGTTCRVFLMPSEETM